MSSTPNHPAFVTTVARDFEMFTQQATSNELEGLRLAVKDVFDMQGMPTSAGNPTWLESHPIPSSTHSSVVSLLSKGAQFVGKTMTDELAYSLNGQNVHFPQLLNPITPDRLVGGSSSGSAAAVACNLADIGLGTDTGGSIRVPASYNGLYGFRPTHGVIPCDDMLSLAPSFDTVGWLTRDFETLEKVAAALLPNNDPSAENQTGVSAVESDAAIPVCVVTDLVDASEHASEIYDWIAKLEGVETTSITIDAEALQTSETFRVLQGLEIWQEHGNWITDQKPTFAKDIEKRIHWCRQLTDAQREQASRQQHVIQQHMNHVAKNNLAMLIPTTPGRSPLLDVDENKLATYREDLMALTAIAGLTGRPQIHLPMFTIDGAPCGVSLIGNKHADLQLISIAKKLITNNLTATRDSIPNTLVSKK